MTRTPALLAALAVLALAAGTALWTGLKPARAEPLWVSLQTGALPGWAVIYELEVNGRNGDPLTWNAVWYSDTQGPAGTGSIIMEVPARPEAPSVLRIEATWIEWHTGRAWTASLDDPTPEESVIVFFAPGGELRLYQPGPALREGTLGRAVRFEDFELTARTCAAPLPASDPRAAKLDELRAGAYRFDPAELPPLADPLPPSDCSNPTVRQ